MTAVWRRLLARLRWWWRLSPAAYDKDLNQMYEAGYTHAREQVHQELAAREAYAEARGYWRAVDEIFKYPRSSKQDERPSIH